MRFVVSYSLLLAIPAACSSAPSTGASSASGTGGSEIDGGGIGGAGGTASQPDAGCYMNGGFACVTNADCPPSDGCDFCFSCDLIPDGTKVCRWHPLDAGFCDPF